MKIITKSGVKDYYDYLVGKYGVDPLRVLDRTEYYRDILTPSEKYTVDLYICGYHLQGVYLDGRYRYGKDLEPYGRLRSYWRTDKLLYDIEGVNKNILQDKVYEPEGPNFILDCPILIRTGNGRFIRDKREYEGQYDAFPLLKDYNVQSVFTPEEIWLLLVDWLSVEKPVVNNLTNKEKIVTHGFDLKSSFRRM